MNGNISKIETVCSVKLPIGETLEIKRNRLAPAGGAEGKKRISIVTGIHGDELEGQYICYEVARRIKEQPELLSGVVDIYPAMNPLGIDSMTRGIPGFDLDMNRIFPGTKNGAMTEYVANEIIKSLSGSDLCVDIHASNIYLTEIPQIRINELHKDTLVPLARLMNVDFVWIHASSTVLESTLAYSLNSTGTPTLVVEAGVGMRITKAYCEQLADGLMNTMHELGIWKGDAVKAREPIVSGSDDSVVFFNAPKAGIFIPAAKHWETLEKGDVVERIVNPLEGEIIREYPVVDEGSLVGRLLKTRSVR